MGLGCFLLARLDCLEVLEGGGWVVERLLDCCCCCAGGWCELGVGDLC
jgi:hypothetical protein